MRIPVYTDSQLNEMLLPLKPGETYMAFVRDPEEGRTQAGDPKIQFTLEVDDKKGKIVLLRFSSLIVLPKEKNGHAFLMKQIYDFLASAGIPYQEDALSASRIKDKKVYIIPKVNKKSGYLVVDKYVSQKEKDIPTFDDDIPFG